jgi:hypothetical protein
MSADSECLADHNPPFEFPVTSEITVACLYPSRDPDTEGGNRNEIAE